MSIEVEDSKGLEPRYGSQSRIMSDSNNFKDPVVRPMTQQGTNSKQLRRRNIKMNTGQTFERIS